MIDDARYELAPSLAADSRHRHSQRERLAPTALDPIHHLHDWVFAHVLSHVVPWLRLGLHGGTLASLDQKCLDFRQLLAGRVAFTLHYQELVVNGSLHLGIRWAAVPGVR